MVTLQLVLTPAHRKKITGGKKNQHVGHLNGRLKSDFRYLLPPTPQLPSRLESSRGFEGEEKGKKKIPPPQNPLLFLLFFLHEGFEGKGLEGEAKGNKGRKDNTLFSIRGKETSKANKRQRQ